MRRNATPAVLALGLAAVLAGAARAETLTVSAISNSPASVGNIVIISGSAAVRVDAGTGAVTFPTGTGVRIKTNGASPGNLPTQLVTVSCTNGSGGNCKHAYRVLITQAAASGQATSVSKINVSNITQTGGTVVFSSAPEAAPGQIFTATGSSNTFSFTFQVGATANVNAAGGHSASWSYNVQVTQ